jgi:hypothetical protein
MLPEVWEAVPVGTCVEKWLDVLQSLGADIRKVPADDTHGPDWYVFWCPKKVEFYGFQVSLEIDDNCSRLEARLRNMASVKDQI